MGRALTTLVLGVLAASALAQPIVNGSFEDGTAAWYAFGPGTLATDALIVQDGTQSARLTNRTDTWNGIGQSLLGDLTPGQTYAVSAFLYADSPDEQSHTLTVRQDDAGGTAYHNIAYLDAPGGQWRRVAGVFTYQPDGAVTNLTFYAEGPEAGVDLYLDGVVFEATVSESEWVAEADARIDAIRKRDVTINLISDTGAPIVGAAAQIQQDRRHFGFGTAISSSAINNAQYQGFLRDNFEWGVCENATKWAQNEPTQDQLDFGTADQIVAFCNANGIRMRGHTLFWSVDQFVPSWVQGLGDTQLRDEVSERITDVVGRYAGDFEHWDVNNEMLHGSFYQDRLGPSIRTSMFQEAEIVAPGTRWFVNDYNVVTSSAATAYAHQIQGLMDDGAPVGGVGAQGHFVGPVSGPAVLARLDILAELGLPIWLTEVDVVSPDENVRADRLETVMRAAFSHPGVDGVLLWGFWANAHWRGPDAALVDADFTVNAAGQRYLQLMDDWSTEVLAPTGSGTVGFRGFHGTYDITVTPADGTMHDAAFDVPVGIDPIEIDVVIPGVCPADQDGDGDADSDDIAAFVSAFIDGLAGNADIDGDGDEDADDISTFVDVFIAGCA